MGDLKGGPKGGLKRWLQEGLKGGRSSGRGSCSCSCSRVVVAEEEQQDIGFFEFRIFFFNCYGILTIFLKEYMLSGYSSSNRYVLLCVTS